MVDMNYNAPIAALLKEAPALKDRHLMVFDVGASGGLEGSWRQLGNFLQAECFDPLVTEVDRLNSAEPTNIRYHAAWITADNPDICKSVETGAKLFSGSFQFTSAQRAVNAQKVDYRQAVFNSGAELKYTDRYVSIDAFCREQGIATVDFLKVDTDGHDIGVLLGARETLTERGLLGAMIECQYHGATHAHANTFANIDILMRECGFTLFLLDAWQYSRAGLPGVFYYDIQAQTRTGQVQWGDAVYLLDPITRPELFEKLDAADLLKLLMVYDLFNLRDCIATLVVEMRQRKIEPTGVDLDRVLDLCVPPNPYGLNTYRQYVDFFDEDPSRFYASRWDATVKLPTPRPASELASPEPTGTSPEPAPTVSPTQPSPAPKGFLARLFGN
jgi:FkbM family methyltransferase